jgi:hypothetical protein
MKVFHRGHNDVTEFAAFKENPKNPNGIKADESAPFIVGLKSCGILQGNTTRGPSQVVFVNALRLL